MSDHTRRSVLAASASALAVSLAGCSSLPGQSDAPMSNQPFYVENFTDTDRRFTISILRSSDESEVVTGYYRLPAGEGVRFPNVGNSGETYDVAVAFDSRGPLTRNWEVEPCPSSSKEGRAAAMYVREDSTGFDQNGCDSISVGSELTYLSPEDARIPPEE